MVIGVIISFIKKFFLVNRCFICGEILKQVHILETKNSKNINSVVCCSCIKELAFTNYAPIENFKAIMSGKNKFTKAIAPFYYTKSIKRAILRFKFKNQKRLAAFFARYMYIAISENYFYQDIDYIIPVPISKSKLRKRGYNQAKLLADELSLALNKEVLINVLIKVGDNETQSKLCCVEDRINNVKNVYKVISGDKIKDKKILLIDDVITTGATINEVSNELLKEKPKSIVVLSIAYVKNKKTEKILK